MVLMKARIYLLMMALCATTIFVGCEKSSDAPSVDNAVKVVGQWHCAPESYDVDVYVSFDAAGTFDEYQRLGEGRYRHYAGTWSVEKDILSGVYADGTGWGSTYTLLFDGDTMTLTSMNDSAEAMVYTKTTIPQAVIDEAIEPLGPETLTRGIEMRWF
jgi:hypothetical protein